MIKGNLSQGSMTPAIVLVDYANVCSIISDLLVADHNPDELAIRMVAEIRAYATDFLNMNVVQTIAFDSISSEDPRPHRATAAWIANGIESRVHMLPTGKSEASIDLGIEATKAVWDDKRVDSVIILTGDQWYVPLVRSIRSSGKFVFVASLDAPETSGLVATDLRDAYFNARTLFERAGRSNANGVALPFEEGTFLPQEELIKLRPEEVSQVEDSIGREALEIIEQYFGQYEEVYLTPLLRRLTELTETEEEPKATINYLEDCGAVWLEKRRGFPHNFTVLLVNEVHPDVIEIKQSYADKIDEFSEDYENVEQKDLVQSEQMA